MEPLFFLHSTNTTATTSAEDVAAKALKKRSLFIIRIYAAEFRKTELDQNDYQNPNLIQILIREYF